MKKAFGLDKLCFSGTATKYFWSSQAGKQIKKKRGYRRKLGINVSCNIPKRQARHKMWGMFSFCGLRDNMLWLLYFEGPTKAFSLFYTFDVLWMKSNQQGGRNWVAQVLLSGISSWTRNSGSYVMCEPLKPKSYLKLLPVNLNGRMDVSFLF